MSGAIPPLRQYAFKTWCSVKETPGQISLSLSILLFSVLHFADDRIQFSSVFNGNVLP
jgi:hypothetical protein